MQHYGTDVAAPNNHLCVAIQLQLGTHNSSVGQYKLLQRSATQFVDINVMGILNLITSTKGLLMTAGVGASLKSSMIIATTTQRQDRHCSDKW